MVLVNRVLVTIDQLNKEFINILTYSRETLVEQIRNQNKS